MLAVGALVVRAVIVYAACKLHPLAGLAMAGGVVAVAGYALGRE